MFREVLAIASFFCGSTFLSAGYPHMFVSVTEPLSKFNTFHFFPFYQCKCISDAFPTPFSSPSHMLKETYFPVPWLLSCLLGLVSQPFLQSCRIERIESFSLFPTKQYIYSVWGFGVFFLLFWVFGLFFWKNFLISQVFLCVLIRQLENHTAWLYLSQDSPLQKWG